QEADRGDGKNQDSRFIFGIQEQRERAEEMEYPILHIIFLLKAKPCEQKMLLLSLSLLLIRKSEKDSRRSL
ncbi:hypothetical protein KIL84_022765, partial [Mauremys mutica]